MKPSHTRGIVVGRGRRGRGVFAERRFREGEVVETCPAVAIPDADVRGLVRNYVFDSRIPGKVLLVLGYAMLYNHAAQPNLYHRIAGRLTIEFVALRDIAAGEELTQDYGPAYWEDRARRPR